MKKTIINSRVILVALLILCLVKNIKSQEAVLFKQSIKTDIPSYEGGQYILLDKIYGHKFYTLFLDYLDNYISKATIIRFDVTDLESGKSNMYKINFNTNKKLMDEVKNNYTNISDYIIEGENLYILACIYILKFKLNGDEYKLTDIIPIQNRIYSQFLSNISDKEAIIASHYNIDGKKNRYNIFSAKVNLRNGKVANCIFPEFKGIGFSLYKSNWWSFTDKQMLLGGNLEYKIRIYNKTTLQLTDSIVYNKPGFLQNTLEVDTFKYSDKNSIHKLLELNRKYFRIFNSFFINDSTILIVNNKADKNYKYIDVWRKINGKWELVLEDGKTSDEIPKDSLICINNNFLGAGLSSSRQAFFWNNYLVKRNRLYFNVNFFIGKPFGYYIKCLGKNENSPEIINNVDYEHSGILFFEFAKP